MQDQAGPLQAYRSLTGQGEAGGAEFAAWQNAGADTFLAVEEADKGIKEMSEKFRKEGGEIYVPAT